VASLSGLEPLHFAANALGLNVAVWKESHHYPTLKSPHHPIPMNERLVDVTGVDA
jgi:hypothetical protein